MIKILLSTLLLVASAIVAMGQQVTDCKVLSVDGPIRVRCGKLIRTFPKAEWPAAWKYDPNDAHNDNAPPVTKEFPSKGDTVKALYIHNSREFIPLEPCQVRVNMKVREWIEANGIGGGHVQPPAMLRTSPSDCLNPPQPLEPEEIDDVIRHRVERAQKAGKAIP